MFKVSSAARLVFALISLVLFLAFSLAPAGACELKGDREYLSLSGPVTHLLEELDLLEDPSLKAISVFHSTKETKTPKVAGGIFLSPKTLSKYKNDVVFFDESAELEKSLKQNGIKGATEVATRGKGPFAANQLALEALRPRLKGCGERLAALDKRLAAIKKKASGINFGQKTYVFYLGKFQEGQRPPELVVVNDGFAKFLKEEAGMKTYPGELAYIPWSQRVLSGLEEVVSIGAHESDNPELKVVEVEKGIFNFGMRGILSPGIKQVHFLERLADSGFFAKIAGKNGIGSGDGD